MILSPRSISSTDALMHELSSVEVVFFDAAGTLFDLRQSPGSLYLKHALRHGFQPINRESVEKDLNHRFIWEFRKSPPLSFPGEKTSELPDLERKWWYRIIRGVFEGQGRFPHIDQFFDEIYHFFGTAEPWALEQGCRETLHYLRDSSYQMGVISNFDSRLFGLLEELGISGYFQSVTISSQAPAAKPDARIFQTAVRQMGSDGRRCLHVGDRVVDDLEGAQSAGVHALLYDPHRRCPDESLLRVTRLTELCRFLV